MSYLLDTNVISETFKQEAHENVVKWFENTPNQHIYMSCLSVGEIRYGIAKLPPSRKKESLSLWLEHHIPEWYEERILSLDTAIMNTWGNLIAAHRPLPVMDSLLAATAITHQLTLVTRNTKDFHDIQNLNIFNPWLSD